MGLINNLPEEFERSKTKLSKIDLRAELASGWGATTSGQSIVSSYHARLAEGFRCALLDAHAGMKSEADLVVLLRGLSPELLALMSIQTLLHSIGCRDELVTTLINLGVAAKSECWAAKLLATPAKSGDKVERKAAKAEADRINSTVERMKRDIAKSHTSVKRRVATMERKVEKLIEDNKLPVSFKVSEWTGQSLTVAGGWLWNVISSSLPEVFERETIQQGPHKTSYVKLSEGSWAIVAQALDRAMVSNPVYWPSATAPKPWTYWNDGGSWDERVTASVLRTHNKDTQAETKQAIKSGQMKPTLDAVNSLQAVAFKINTQVLEVIEQCDAAGTHVKGLVPKNLKRLQKPNAFAWEDMDAQQQGRWYAKSAETDKRNRGYLSDRLLFAEDQKTAFAMLEHPRFYTPMNCDWRGRVYGLSHFNFQREDRVRALFLFADGEAIGEEGIEWLKIHTANCGDFKNIVGEKISKRPLKERVEWCNTNGLMITNIASDPLVHTEWMGADKPFLFLAACFELSAALVQGSSYITRLPISFDGSCSGLQHLCAMTRASEGAMVNLTASLTPQDVYQTICDDTFKAIKVIAETEGDPEADLARLFLGWNGDRRKGVKRNVMTYAYSSKKFGMASQQQVDLMQPLADEVLDGKMEEHPFEGYQHGPYDKHGNRQPSKAARFFAHNIYEAIIERIKMPAEAMEFLQKIAKALAHEGKPVKWTTPAGIPWINRYHEPVVDRVKLFLNDGGLRVRVRVEVTTGDQKAIDKDKAANGVAPNFVHALDASHLLLSVNASVAAGIPSIATVHDSFGCLSSRATSFNRIIREQFALMYETHDVLAEILAQASADITQTNRNRLPTMLIKGTLNLKDILNAQFAFA